MQTLLSAVIGAAMRARRHVLNKGLVAIASAGGLALIGCSAPAMPPGAGKAPTPPGARWVSRFAGPGHADDKASAVAISPAGTTVFVTGTFGFAPYQAPTRTTAQSATTRPPAGSCGPAGTTV